MKYFQFLFYYGRYRISRTKVYETDTTALNEKEALAWFKEKYPNAKLKDWREL